MSYDEEYEIQKAIEQSLNEKELELFRSNLRFEIEERKNKQKFFEQQQLAVSWNKNNVKLKIISDLFSSVINNIVTPCRQCVVQECFHISCHEYETIYINLRLVCTSFKNQVDFWHKQHRKRIQYVSIPKNFWEPSLVFGKYHKDITYRKTCVKIPTIYEYQRLDEIDEKTDIELIDEDYSPPFQRIVIPDHKIPIYEKICSCADYHWRRFCDKRNLERQIDLL